MPEQLGQWALVFGVGAFFGLLLTRALLGRGKRPAPIEAAPIAAPANADTQAPATDDGRLRAAQDETASLRQLLSQAEGALRTERANSKDAKSKDAKPATAATPNPETEKQLGAARAEADSLRQRLSQAETELQTLRSRPAPPAPVVDPTLGPRLTEAQGEAADLRQRLSQAQAELGALRAAPKPAASPAPSTSAEKPPAIGAEASDLRKRLAQAEAKLRALRAKKPDGAERPVRRKRALPREARR